jgi:hypothetical protein
VSTSSNRPFSLRIFLPDGTPEGVRILEKSNWTGCGVYFPRSVFAEAKKRDEFGRTGVYILVGGSEDQVRPTVYIGQGDVVRDRLESHHKLKDFWNWAVFFVSKDESLNRAHVQHLEARLVRLAGEAKRATLDNANNPQPPHLSEADTADVESFLADVLSILPLVGLTAFEKPRARGRKSILLVISSKGVKATGYESPEGFVVKEGSQVVADEVPSIHAYLSTFRKELLQQGVLTTEGESLRFSQDYAFTSPSTAAGVVLGRSANGRIEWKDGKGRILKVIQEESVPSVTSD